MNKKFLMLFLMGTLALNGCGSDSEKSENPNSKEDVKDMDVESVTLTPIPTETQGSEMLAEETGQSPEEIGIESEEPVGTVEEVEPIYTELLNKYYKFICSDDDGKLAMEGEIGVAEAVAGLSMSGALESVGYAINDLSGDGIPELVIGEYSKEDTGFGTMIYALYTIADGEPVLVFEGWYRNCYRWMGENRFACQGSGGAMYSIFGTLELTEDGKELQWKDYYFTHETDESFSEIGCYYNNTGISDVESSEKLDISLEEFFDLETEVLKEKQWMRLTKFSDYQSP